MRNAVSKRSTRKKNVPRPKATLRAGNVCLLLPALELAAQHDIAERKRVEQPGFVGLADDALGQGLGIIGRKQDDVDFVRHIDPVLLPGVEDLQIHDIRVGHVAVVDIVAAPHKRPALIGQFWAKRHRENLLSASIYKTPFLFSIVPYAPACGKPPAGQGRKRGAAYRSSFSRSCFSWFSATCSVRIRSRESIWLMGIERKNWRASSKKMMTTETKLIGLWKPSRWEAQ